MPQINDHEQFLKHLKSQGVGYDKKTVDTDSLKSTQADFYDEKISNLMSAKKSAKKPIFVSNDQYVLDGHHRWIADHNLTGKTSAYVVDLPILDLVHLAKRREKESLTEGVTRKDFAPKLQSFVKFASDKLGIKSLPSVRYKDDSDDFNSFAAYNPTSQEVIISTKNRHPLDIYRSVAHELVHHWQKENGHIGKDIAKEGSTGSPQENHANAEAGKIMRLFAKENPDHFELAPIAEAVFVVGGPCSGKDRIAKSLKEQLAFDEIDIHAFLKSRRAADQTIINASAQDADAIRAAYTILEANGYDVSMIYVDVSNEISRSRNENRAAKGHRVLSESLRFAKYDAASKNKETFKELFGEQAMTIIDNNDLTEETSEATGKLKDVCWKNYTAVGTKKKNGKTVPNCVPKSAIDETIDEPTGELKKACWKGYTAVGTKKKSGKTVPNCVPKQSVDEKFHQEFSGIDLPDPPKMPQKKTKKVLRKKKLAQEAEQSLPLWYGMRIDGSNYIGPTAQSASPYPLLATGTAYTGIAESVAAWASKPETQHNFVQKYGVELAESKLIETMRTLTESMSTNETKTQTGPKYFTQIREAHIVDMGTVPATSRYKDEPLVGEDAPSVDKSKMPCNKPKAQATGDKTTGKSHVVKACSNGQEKIIRFGQRGVKGSPKKEGESESYRKRRESFKARHAQNIQKGKMSAAYWANKTKW